MVVEAPAYRFEVAISFAGDNKRDTMRQVAEQLRATLGDGKVFFDEWFEAELAGPDANVVLQDIYQRESRLVVVSVCERYSEKPWTQDEWRAIQAFERDLRDAGEGNHKRMRFLPLRFGPGTLPGIPLETAIVPEVATRSVEDIAKLILDRLRLARGERTTPVPIPPPPRPVRPFPTLLVVLALVVVGAVVAFIATRHDSDGPTPPPPEPTPIDAHVHHPRPDVRPAVDAATDAPPDAPRDAPPDGPGPIIICRGGHVVRQVLANGVQFKYVCPSDPDCGGVFHFERANSRLSDVEAFRQYGGGIRPCR